MLPDPRILILFGTNVLLLQLTLLVGSASVPWLPYPVLLGPMIVLAPLYLRWSGFFACAVLTGLWVDAALPSPFGLFTVLFPCLGTAFHQARIRFRASGNTHPALLAHLANFVCVLALTATAAGPVFAHAAVWIHVLGTLALSHLALLAVAPWFFNLQRCLFVLCRTEIEPEELPRL